jgi:hypothetical protein
MTGKPEITARNFRIADEPETTPHRPRHITNGPTCEPIEISRGAVPQLDARINVGHYQRASRVQPSGASGC